MHRRAGEDRREVELSQSERAAQSRRSDPERTLNAVDERPVKR